MLRARKPGRAVTIAVPVTIGEAVMMTVAAVTVGGMSVVTIAATIGGIEIVVAPVAPRNRLRRVEQSQFQCQERRRPRPRLTSSTPMTAESFGKLGLTRVRK